MLAFCWGFTIQLIDNIVNISATLYLWSHQWVFLWKKIHIYMWMLELCCGFTTRLIDDSTYPQYYGYVDNIVYVLWIHVCESTTWIVEWCCESTTWECRLFYGSLLQKRPVILRSLLRIATPYVYCGIMLWPPKNGLIALWSATNRWYVVKCVSQKRNWSNNKSQWYNILVTFILKFSYGLY